MKSNTAIIREIIQYLRSLNAEHFNDRYKREAVCRDIQAMGAKYLSEGCYSYVYAVDKFVIKISSDKLEKLRTARSNKVFRRFAPPVYWIHDCGRACVCERVEIDHDNWRRPASVYRRVREMMLKAGFTAFDLHSANLVKIKGTRVWRVVDYGCWIG